MGYIPLENIVRGAIANKGHSTLHLFVPFLHFAFDGIRKYQQESVYTEIRYKKVFLGSDNCIPFPEDMLMWSKVGVIANGRMQLFINDEGLSLDPSDHNRQENALARGLFSFDSDSLDILYTTNVFVSTSTGVVQVNFARSNTFRVNWMARKFQIGHSTGQEPIYIEYIAKAHDPSTQTLINELALDYIENYIFFREARFRLGASHRETRAAEGFWLDEQDELRGSLSDLTGTGVLSAQNIGTRKTIDQ